MFQLLSILLSCVWFAHPLSWEQYIGAVSIPMSSPIVFFCQCCQDFWSDSDFFVRPLSLVLFTPKLSWEPKSRSPRSRSQGHLIQKKACLLLWKTVNPDNKINGKMFPLFRSRENFDRLVLQPIKFLTCVLLIKWHGKWARPFFHE